MLTHVRLFNSESFNSINLVHSYFLETGNLVKKENTMALLKSIIDMVNFSGRSMSRNYIYASELNNEYVKEFIKESTLSEKKIENIYSDFKNKLIISFKLRLLSDEDFVKDEFSLTTSGMVRFKYKELLEEDNSYSRVIFLKNEFYSIKDDMKNRTLRGLYYYFDYLSDEDKNSIKNVLFKYIY